MLGEVWVAESRYMKNIWAIWDQNGIRKGSLRKRCLSWDFGGSKGGWSSPGSGGLGEGGGGVWMSQRQEGPGHARSWSYFKTFRLANFLDELFGYGRNESGDMIRFECWKSPCSLCGELIRARQAWILGIWAWVLVAWTWVGMGEMERSRWLLSRDI